MTADTGLSCDDAVYQTMLACPGLGLAGIAERLGIGEARVRASLDRLADLALVRVGPDVSVVCPVRPGAGLAALLSRAEADIAARQREIEATRIMIAGIVDTYSENSRDQPRRLDGLDAVRERLVELAAGARAECVSFSTGGAQDPVTMRSGRPLNLDALERGVELRNVYLDSFRNDPDTLAHARWMAAHGSQSRTTATLPVRLLVVDRATALVPIDPADTAAGALEITSPGVVAGLYALFEQVWRQAIPFGDVPQRDADGLTNQERELLRLYAAGHTDESAARKLAVSARSVQRMMTALTERLHAASRFQAGVEATRRGWT